MKHTSFRIFSCLLAIVLVMGALVVFPMTASAELTNETSAIGTGDAVWDGTSTDASWLDEDTYATTTEFYIYTAAQLAAICSFTGSINDNGNTSSMQNVKYDFAGKTIYLMNDIYLNNITEIVSDTEFTRATDYKWDNFRIHDFHGTFDGLGHTVYGLYVNGVYNQGAGFFGRNYNNKGIIIRNLNMYYCEVENNNAGAGAIIGQLGNGTVTIENCHAIGTVSASAGFAGGIAGTHRIDNSSTWNGTIDGCTFRGFVEGIYPNSYNNGTNEHNASVGGIVSNTRTRYANETTTISNCTVWGTVSATHGTNAGGILGSTRNHKLDNATTVENCAFYGTIQGGTNSSTGHSANRPAVCGGIIGQVAPEDWENRGDGTNNDFSYVYVKNCIADVTFIALDDSTKSYDRFGAVVGWVSAKMLKQGSLIENVHYNAAFEIAGDGDNVTYEPVTKQIGYTTNMSITDLVDTATVTEYTEDAALTDGTLTAAMNTVALANDLQPWIQGTTAPIHINQLTPSGATMSLTSTMQLNIKFAESELATVAAAAQAAGKTISVAVKNADGSGVSATSDGNGYYSAAFESRAYEMSDAMSLRMVFTVGGKHYESAVATGYSVITYLTNIYEDYKDDANETELIDLITDMMFYAAAAETNKYGTTNILTELTNRGFVAPEWNGYAEHISASMTQTDKDKINAIANTGAVLANGIDIVFDMQNAAYTTLTVNGETYTVGEDGNIIFDGIAAGNILDVYTLTFSGEGVEDVTAKFVVGNFLDGRQASGADAEVALARATIFYMMSARAYVMSK